MKQKITLGSKKLIALVATASLSFTGTALADILGHWRFEEGAFLTNSAGDGTGTLTPTGTTPTQYSLPDEGAGSDFYNPLPFNGASNNSAASFSGAGRLLTDGLTKGDFAGLRTLTIEGMFNLNSIDGASGIASMWASSANSRSFFFGIDGGVLRGGTYIGANQAFSTSLEVQAGIDYYAAMVVTGNDTLDAIFYLKDLTNDGPLQVETISFDPASAQLTSSFSGTNSSNRAMIGSISNDSFFNGIIDEVRIANSALSADQLMIVPEPATYALLFGSVALLGMAFRGRRKR